MATPNQIHWQHGDWALLKAFIAAKLAGTAGTLFPAGIVIDHNYFEDIRKIIWLLEHIHAGNYDDSVFEWGEGANVPPSQGDYDDDEVHHYAGLWEVSTLDTSQGLGTYDPVTQTWSGRWIRWRNKSDLTYGSCNDELDPPFAGPPTSIHPADNEWITSNANWEIAPSPNYYHDWDSNSLFKTHYNQLVYYEGVELARDERYFAASNYYPKQTDPKEQFTPVIYGDTQQKDFRFRQKVGFDHLFITKTSAMGAVFDAWSRWVWDVVTSHAVSGLYTGILKWTGNQYAHTQFTPQDNSSNPEFSYNPKICDALQPKIEMLLSCGGFRLPADSTYTANFRIFHNLAAGDVTEENSAWDDYPAVNDHKWGENESGFELFLKKRGIYDWYFDSSHPYNPLDFQRQAIELNHTATPTRTEQDYKVMWQCDSASLLGTWRKTWHNSLGRVSPFMRSGGVGEMGEPSHRKDNWDADVTLPPSGYDTDDKWFGARTNAASGLPTLDYFDDRYALITKVDDYSFTVDGDITANLKIGWMFHLCVDASESVPAIATADCLPAYTLSVKYNSDTDVTTVISSELIGSNTKICWNKEVSQRHDGINASWKIVDGTMTYTIHYYPTAELILEMKEILELNLYRDIYIGSQRISWGWNENVLLAETQSHYNTNCEITNDGFTFPIPAGVFVSVWGNIWETLQIIPSYSYWMNPDYMRPNGWGGTGNDIGIYWYFQYAITGTPPSYSSTGGAWAIKLTWPETLTNLPKQIACRFKILDVIQNESSNWEQISSQSAGGLSSRIIPWGSDDKYRYVRGFLSVDGQWHFYKPEKNPVVCRYVNEDGSIVIESGKAWLAGLGQAMECLYDSGYVITLDWEDVPESVWQRDFIGHVDVEETPVADNMPPRPNPAVFHTNPHATFTLVPFEGIYGEESYVPPKFQLRIESEVCLCEDNEGSDPVKYQAVCDDDEDLTSEWLTSRETSVLVKDLPIVALDMQTIPIPTGYQVQHSGSVDAFAVGDKISITGIQYNIDGVYVANAVGTVASAGAWATGQNYSIGTVRSYSGAYYQLYSKVGYSLTATPPNAPLNWKVVTIGTAYVQFNFSGSTWVDNAGTVANLSKIYTEADWTAETPVNTYKFGARAKDSASPTNNIGKIGTLVTVEAPTEYPADIIEAAGGIEFD